MSRPLLAEYVAAGWALVPIPPGLKGPVAAGWNLREQCITDPEIAEHLDGNVGLAHAYSGTCAIDCDDLATAKAWLTERGINLDEYLTAIDAVILSSGRENRAKLIYSVVSPLPSFKLPGFELRCASRTGTTVQDVLPPSIHPDTGKPYEWRYGDDVIGHWSVLPPLPEALRALWQAQIKPDTKVPPRERAPRSASLGRARELLNRHDPDSSYDDWLRCGMALHHETEGGLDGLDLWNEWSSHGSKYKGREDLDLHWRSFHSDTANPITIASLRVDQAAQAEEFPLVTEADIEQARLPAPRTPSALKEALNTLKRDKLGHALAVLPNILPIISVPELCGQQLAYDQFQDAMICAPYGTDTWRPIRDTDYTAFRVWLEEYARFHPVSKELVRDAIYYIAEAHKMDTAQKWLSSLKWDGKPRVKTFLPQYFGTIATAYEYSIGEYLWTALAGRIMSPGCQADMAIILVGEQGVGKSQGVKAIAPWPESYLELRLDEADDAIARKMRGCLIAEIAELRGFNRPGEMERIKAFMTRTHEKWIPKFIEFATDFARRCICIGTTNQDEFLTDIQNRRWLPVRTVGVDVEGIKRDREQLWAEGLQMWMDGGIAWQQAQELAKDNQEEYKVPDNWTDILEKWISELPAEQVIKTNDVLIQAIGLDVRHINRAHQARVCDLMKIAGYEQKLLRDEQKKVYRGWVKKQP